MFCFHLAGCFSPTLFRQDQSKYTFHSMSTSYSDFTCIFWLNSVNPRQMQRWGNWVQTGTQLQMQNSGFLFLSLSTSPHYPCGILSLSGSIALIQMGPMKVAREGRGVAYFWFPISPTCASFFLIGVLSSFPHLHTAYMHIKHWFCMKYL